MLALIQLTEKNFAYMKHAEEMANLSQEDYKELEYRIKPEMDDESEEFYRDLGASNKRGLVDGAYINMIKLDKHVNRALYY